MRCPGNEHPATLADAPLRGWAAALRASPATVLRWRLALLLLWTAA